MLSLLPWIAQCISFLHPTHLSCFILFEYEQFCTRQQENKGKNLRPVSPYCPHSLDFPCTKWLPRNTQEAQTFLPCYWSVTRWRSLLLNWKRCLLFSLQDFPCQQIKNLDAELQLFLPWNDKFFVSIYYYEKVGHLKENIFIKRKKKKTEQGGITNSSKVRLLF